MGPKETRNRVRNLAASYAKGKMLCPEDVEELEELLMKQTRWALKRIRDVMPKL